MAKLTLVNGIDYKTIWNVIKEGTVLVTASGLFINYIVFPYFQTKKRQKELSILLINILTNQLDFLNNIYGQVYNINNTQNYGKNKEANIKKINSYYSQLNNLSLFEKTLESIGIYDKREIDILSKYYCCIKETLVIIEVFILNQDNYDYALVNNIITISLANECIFTLEDKYKVSGSQISLSYLLENFCSQINKLKICNSQILDKIINNLKYLQERHKEKYNYIKLNKKELILFVKKATINSDMLKNLSERIALFFLQNQNHNQSNIESVQKLENTTEENVEFNRMLEKWSEYTKHTKYIEEKDTIYRKLEKNLDSYIICMDNNAELMEENFRDKVLQFIDDNLSMIYGKIDIDFKFTTENKKNLCTLIINKYSEQEQIKFLV